MERSLSVTVAIVALTLGVFADIAVRDSLPGLALFLWFGGLILAIVFLQRSTEVQLVRGWKTIAAAALIIGSAFVWRASGALQAFAFLGSGALFVLIGLKGAHASLEECSLLEYAHAGVVSVANAAVGFPMLLFSDIRWESTKEGGTRNRTVEIIRGLAIAVPVILVLGALFAGADEIFQNLVFSIFDIDLAKMLRHLFFVGFITWIVAGYLRGYFIVKPSPFPYAQTRALSLGITEIAIILGSSILLFSVFLTVQFRYLFGGASLIQVTPTLTYAQYARRGFFELTAVVALVLPILLGLDWLLKTEKSSHVRAFRILAAIQVVLVFAVMVSAVQRMLLYQQEYGLTELRVYTVAFMGWMAVLFAWYMLTVLSGRRARFAIGVVGAGFGTIVILLLLNPDNLIARTNIARAVEGKQMDVKYLTALSDDAVPALVDGLSALDAPSRTAVARELLRRKQRLDGSDWRSWNWSSYSALQLLSTRESDLRACAEN